MKLLRALSCVALACATARAGDASETAADVASGLRHLSLDAGQTYHVRDLRLNRGGIEIFLTDGVLSFATPINGHCVAAVFTTRPVEAGDAEVLAIPPDRAERASLAFFTNSPNLDEHFTSALFFFSDDTANELVTKIQGGSLPKTPESMPQIEQPLGRPFRAVASMLGIRLIRALLDSHKPGDGFFYSVFEGRDLGLFEAMYDPAEFEPVEVGRVSVTAGDQPRYELWTSFRSRHAPAYVMPPVTLRDYQIDATVRPDLSMSNTAEFAYRAQPEDGRVIPLSLSDRLNVLSASVDDKPVEVFAQHSTRLLQRGAGTFLLILDAPLHAGKEYKVEVHYEGSVIRRTQNGAYFVNDRDVWYPFRNPMLTTFALTFHCPENLRLASSGELISEHVDNDVRTVYRKTEVAEHLAGFNLGEYDTVSQATGAYRVECYRNKNVDTVVASATRASDHPAISSLAPPRNEPQQPVADIATQTESILEDYTRRWMPLPIHSVAVTPIPGYFGQGFPGLIYLSTVSYIPEEQRPAQLRNARMDTFFSELLLPHEIAHQWWGNIVTPADYRTDWLMEAMANYSALQFLSQAKGQSIMNDVLAQYRDDLLREKNGKTTESAGPIDFGTRLEAVSGLVASRIITYEKGTYILRMLNHRLGNGNFGKLQADVLREFATTPISNENFRTIAARFLPPGDPDKALTLFFDTWIYGTGVPRLRLRHSARAVNLDLSGVEEDFTADIPITCTSQNGKPLTRWVRASAGSNSLSASFRTCELPDPADFLYAPWR